MTLDREQCHSPPGDYLRTLMDKADISGRELAKHIGVSPAYVSDIIHAKRRISTDMAIRLGKAFGPAFGATARFWAESQMEWDLQMAEAGFPERELPQPISEPAP